jgi:hypothetical protein
VFNRRTHRGVAKALPTWKGKTIIDVTDAYGVSPEALRGGRRVVLLASDDDGAAAEIGALAEHLGFSPIKLGGLLEGGLLVQPRGKRSGQLIFKNLVKFDCCMWSVAERAATDRRMSRARIRGRRSGGR